MNQPLRVSWDWQYVEKIMPDLLEAFITVTIPVTFIAFFFAVVVGMVFALLKRSSKPWIAKPVNGFVEFIRYTPLIVQAFFIYYVFPQYTPLSLGAFTTGVLALGLHYSTYMSEVYRSGIEAVSKGQWEAGTALNFSKLQMWTRIILPQAIPPVIPVMGNYLIIMFKETPILAAITLAEMLAVAKGFGSGTFRYLEPITIVGLLFLLVSYPSSLLVRRLELRMNRQRGT